MEGLFLLSGKLAQCFFWSQILLGPVIWRGQGPKRIQSDYISGESIFILHGVVIKLKSVSLSFSKWPLPGALWLRAPPIGERRANKERVAVWKDGWEEGWRVEKDKK